MNGYFVRVRSARVRSYWSWVWFFRYALFVIFVQHMEVASQGNISLLDLNGDWHHDLKALFKH